MDATGTGVVGVGVVNTGLKNVGGVVGIAVGRRVGVFVGSCVGASVIHLTVTGTPVDGMLSTVFDEVSSHWSFGSVGCITFLRLSFASTKNLEEPILLPITHLCK